MSTDSSTPCGWHDDSMTCRFCHHRRFPHEVSEKEQKIKDAVIVTEGAEIVGRQVTLKLKNRVKRLSTSQGLELEKLEALGQLTLF